jgi:hypothetical protein
VSAPPPVSLPQRDGWTPLSTTAFLACWAALGLGELPVAAGLRPVGHTLDEQDRLHRAALAALAHRGLADATRTGPTPGPWLVAALTLLDTGGSAPRSGNTVSTPSSYLADLRVLGAGALLVLGASDGERGVLARFDGDDRVSLRTLPGPSVPAALVELAGPLRPARSRPVNVPVGLLERAVRECADDHPWQVADRLRELGMPGADTAALARMLTGVTAIGQLGVCAGGRRGARVVGFHRGHAGACLQLRDSGTLTVAPATAALVSARLADLITVTRGPATTPRPPGTPT